jgi:bifunctional DNase/RNase
MHLHLRGVCRNAVNAGPALVLEDDPGVHRLVIGIPPCEAPRLAHEIRRGPGCDPSIYSVASALLGAPGRRDAQVWVDLGEDQLVAEIRWEGDGESRSLPCQPRDAVVLAAVAGVPIVAGERLARRIQACLVGGAPMPLPDPRSWLDRVRPEDFA